jgi:hypothetical protein
MRGGLEIGVQKVTTGYAVSEGILGWVAIGIVIYAVARSKRRFRIILYAILTVAAVIGVALLVSLALSPSAADALGELSVIIGLLGAASVALRYSAFTRALGTGKDTPS